MNDIKCMNDIGVSEWNFWRMRKNERKRNGW